MPSFYLETLDRKAYTDSITRMDDDRSIGFANLARDWWDRHFSWKAQGCVVLSDETNTHLSYIFYKIDRYSEYLTVHNLFTPFPNRRQGYAKELLRLVFQRACNEHVGRFRLASVPQSLKFYTSLGFVYWGINTQGDYYCDLPLPRDGLDGIKTMVKTTRHGGLIGEKFDTIYDKVRDNERLLSDEQRIAFTHDTDRLGKSYMHDELMAFKETRN